MFFHSIIKFVRIRSMGRDAGGFFVVVFIQKAKRHYFDNKYMAKVVFQPF